MSSSSHFPSSSFVAVIIIIIQKVQVQQIDAESSLSYASEGAAYSDIQSKVIRKKKEVVGSDLGNFYWTMVIVGYSPS